MYIIFLAYWIFKRGRYLASHVFCYGCTKKSILYEHKYIYIIFDFFLMQNLSHIIKFSKKCNIFLLDCANFVSRNGWQIKTKDAEEIFIVLKKRFFIMQKQIIFLHLYLVNAVNKVKTINNYCLYLSY